MLNIGVTGGIGSGKSTIAALFLERGAHVIDFDALAHTVEEPGEEAWEAIVHTFGRDILSGDGTIDRKKLGAIVFADESKLKKLNEIVHPAIFHEWEHLRRTIEEHDPHAVVVSDIPLLIEGGWQRMFDYLVLVYVSPETQIRRVMTRNGLSRPEVEKRLNAQMPIDAKVPFADFVIDNEGTPEETRAIFEKMWEKIMVLCSTCRVQS